MQTKLIPLASGLALTAALSLVAVVAPDDEAASSDTAAPEAVTTTTTVPDEADSIVTQSATPAITLPLVGEMTVPAPEAEPDEAALLEEYLAAVEEAKLEGYLAAVEEAKLQEYLAAVAEPEPAPASTPAPGPSYAAGSVEEIIARYFGSQTQKALSVARCESGLNPGAMSTGGGNHGLFQINNVHSGTWVSVTGTGWSNRYNAELNTKFAHWLWSQQGWGPWACA